MQEESVLIFPDRERSSWAHEDGEQPGSPLSFVV